MSCLSFFRCGRGSRKVDKNAINLLMPLDSSKQQHQPQAPQSQTKDSTVYKNDNQFQKQKPQFQPRKEDKMVDNDPDHAQKPPPSYLAAQSSSTPLSPPDKGTAEASESNPPPYMPPYHNWQEAVPDTSTFPPPPITGYFNSNTGNASSDDAQCAHEFCDNTPLWNPVKPSAAVFRSAQEHDLRPVLSNQFSGRLSPIARGRWSGSTRDRNGDCIVLTNIPLYFPVEDSPLVAGKSRKMIYFEVKLLGLRTGPGSGSADSSGLSIGFAAQPYPSWRSPGWERGSLGVFSDDGCRFVNDSWGGTEFTSEFRIGETVGLGMTFSLPDKGLSSQMSPNGRKLTVDVFFTRNGRRTGGWDLHEEVDQEAGSVEGLEGAHDLYGAVGLFGGVDFEACFDPAGWLWRPE